MNAKFFDLKKEKQDRMINAALKIFALRGYRHASTDDIVKEAAISKGLLFHYFGSKLGVYTFVYDYSVKYMNLELNTCLDAAQKDLFEVIKLRELARMHAMRGYPYMQQFLNRSVTEEEAEAIEATAEQRKVWREKNEEILAQIDFERMPHGVDGQKIFKMFDYTITGMMTEHFYAETFKPEDLYKEITEYLDMMKKVLIADKSPAEESFAFEA